MRKVAVVMFVVMMALGSTAATGIAGAQTTPSPADALCGSGDDPLAALPPEVAEPLAPLTSVLGQLVTTVCDAVPEGGGLPGLPEGDGGDGGAPGLGDLLGPICGPLEQALAAVPEPFAALSGALDPVIGLLCGDGGEAPADPGELCVPLDAFLGSIPAPLSDALAPVTDLVEQLVGTLCSALVGAPGDGGEEPPSEEPAPEAAPTPTVLPEEATPSPTLPRTGGDTVPLAAGAGLAALAGALRWGMRARRR